MWQALILNYSKLDVCKDELNEDIMCSTFVENMIVFSKLFLKRLNLISIWLTSIIKLDILILKCLLDNKS